MNHYIPTSGFKMRIIVTVFFMMSLVFISCSKKSEPGLTISEIKCIGLENPLGVNALPDFSWILKGSHRGEAQSAYQIIVGTDSIIGKNNSATIWDSGKNLSEQSVWIPYSGPDLQSGKEYFWRIRVWDEKDKTSNWSKAGKFVTGLFEKKDWNGAKWIGYEDIPDSLLLVPGVHGNGDNLGNIAKKRTIVPLFRKNIQVEKKIKRAFVFVSGLGQYELSVNGNKIGDRFLSPGWSDYRKTCFYNTFDITENLKHGLNTIGAIVGNGFYNINRERYRKLVIAYGAPKIILKVDIYYSDGSKESVVTDNSWKTAPSPITYTSIYGGEDYDARLEQRGWDTPDFNDASWKNALLVKVPQGIMKPETDYPVTVAAVMEYKKISSRKDSVFIYDYRQNASGIIKIKVTGKEGQVIRFTPGELLGSDSLVTQEATGGPFYFTYTLKGGGEEIWIPKFTYYGFRYVQVSGAVPGLYPNPANLPVINNIQFLHTRNSSPQTGTFRCSNELFNSIYELINWSMRSNLASVATDCPHREKLGWLEQTHLMGNSLKFVYDIHNLYNKVIDDMMEAQLENGLVPDIAPEYVPFAEGFRDSPEWGSACIILPWDMYQWYGDLEAVRKAYPMMKRYLRYLEGMSDKHILSHGLGDWYDLGPAFPGEAQLTPKSLTATSMFFYDSRLLSEMAKLLGEKSDADYFTTLSEDIRKAFNAKFFNPVTKVYSTGSQTAYSMPLFFGIADDSIKRDVVKNLVRSINKNNNALTAGDIGYRYLLRTLEAAGQSQLIFDMNSRKDVPGYGYQLSKGATSLTESWAALKYVSNNHMMLGHLMEWFYSGIGGIRQAPGSVSYSKIIIYPEIVGDLSWAETTYKTVHGDITCNWKVEKNNILMHLNIPVNTIAIVSIPQTNPQFIFDNEILLKQVSIIKVMEVSSSRTLLEIPSGEYNLRAHINNR
jgi:alpha-L-rhamnosidase